MCGASIGKNADCPWILYPGCKRFFLRCFRSRSYLYCDPRRSCRPALRRSISVRHARENHYLHESLGEFVCQENATDKYDIPRYTTTERSIENTVAEAIKVGRHTVEYITTFLYCDWLYFLRHGINYVIRNVLKC